MIKDKKSLNKKIIITGGGSGGHVSAATGIIDELIKQYSNAKDQILYIGGQPVSESLKVEKSIEQRRFENGDINFKAIRAGKLQRVFRLSSIKILLGVFGGLIDAWKVISTFNPDLIISTGGYVTVPVSLVARLKKIPLYIHEQTAAVGLSNRIAAKFAKRIYTAFPHSAKFLSQDKIMQTGNILRACTWDRTGSGELVSAIKKMEKIREETGKPIIYISGGGQGSHFINAIIRQMLKYILLDAQIVLQTGESGYYKDYEVMIKEKNKLPAKLKDSFYPIRFISADEIGYLFDRMDIYLGRSGANIVYEMGILRKPSILIPIPWVTNDEQNKNAQVLVDSGLGKILPQGETTPQKLYNTIQQFVTEWKKDQYKGDLRQINNIFVKDAAEKIVKDILSEKNHQSSTN